MPVEDEIRAVQLIFRLYTRRRLGCRAIATYLNDRGLHRRGAHRKADTTPRMQPWSHKTVADVLTNRVYLGEVHFREIIALKAHDAVIDEAVFDLAQEIPAQGGEAPKKAGSPSDYHLTGKITCPACKRRYVGTNAVGRSRTYRYYTCWTRSRYGVDHCAAPRIDADALDGMVLDAIRHFYTNCLDDARQAIAASRSKHLQARSGREQDLTVVAEELATKEAIVDRYLTDYENNKIDHETVAARVEKISEQIRQLRHQRDELAFMLDLDTETPDDSHLIEIRTASSRSSTAAPLRSARRCVRQCSPSSASTTASPQRPSSGFH
jgi:site-specific DNA recombinase